MCVCVRERVDVGIVILCSMVLSLCTLLRSLTESEQTDLVLCFPGLPQFSVSNLCFAVIYSDWDVI